MVAEKRARRRLFFALWPEAAVARQLETWGVEAQRRCDPAGRRMRRDGLHMTLAFLGELPVDRVDILRAAAARVGGAGFALCLDRLDHWRHNRIVWAGCGQAPLGLLTLVGRLREQLAAVGLPLEAREFAAHVTLLREALATALPTVEASDGVGAIKAIAWPVSSFVLAASLPQGGGHYEIVGRWPLSDGSGGAGGADATG